MEDVRSMMKLIDKQLLDKVIDRSWFKVHGSRQLRVNGHIRFMVQC